MEKMTKKDVHLLLAFAAFLAAWCLLNRQIQRLDEQTSALRNWPAKVSH